jgi:hypothetical protein
MDKFELLNKKLNSNINYSFVLDKLCFINDDLKKNVIFSDQKYIPFYFHLGNIFKFDRVCQIGFGFGLFSGAYFYGHQKSEYFLAFDDKNKVEVSLQIPFMNVKRHFKGQFYHYCGKINDPKFNDLLLNKTFGLFIINYETSYDEYRLIFDQCWEHLEYQGLLLCEAVKNNKNMAKALDHFSKTINKEILIIDTKYGVASLQKD